MRSLWRCWLLVVAAGALCGPVWADGGFFKEASRLKAELAEPDQKALILHRDGQETLILQATYRGASEHFGWVVPVPNRPRVSSTSAKLFYDLAQLTQPRRRRSTNSAGMQSMGAAPAGVQVVEQLRVGPYDVTVLAAGDANALTNWLRDHHYAAPSDMARVLQPYVDRGWYYVATRIHIESDPDAVLQTIDPTIGDPRQAPEALARKLVYLGAHDRLAGRKLANALDRAVVAPLGGAAARDVAALEMGAGGSARQYYISYADTAAALRDRLISPSAMATCIAGCKDGVSATQFRAAAQAARLYHGQYDGDLVKDLRNSIVRDVLDDVPYARSQVRRFHAALGEARSGPAAGDFASRYETIREALRLSWAAPLSTDREGRLRNLGDHPDAYLPFSPSTLLELASAAGHTYEALEAQVGATLDAVASALAGGTIAPLRLEFRAEEPVYPLRLSSLNPGPTEIQLYLLTEHRMEVPGFHTEFAGQLERRQVPAGDLYNVLAPGPNYLTKLQATMDGSEMTRDLVFSRHRNDRPYHPWAPGEGPFLGPYQGWILAALCFAAAVYYGRRRWRALRAARH